jgi:hypothetical protein
MNHKQQTKQAGKGSSRRPYDIKKWSDGYDKINWNKKEVKIQPNLREQSKKKIETSQ